MRVLTTVATLLLSLVFVTSCYSPLVKRPEMSIRPQDCEATGCNISIKVIDENGEPQIGATVRLINEKAKLFKIKETDTSGEATLPIPGETNYFLLVVNAPGCYPFVEERLIIKTGKGYRLVVRLLSDPSKVT